MNYMHIYVTQKVVGENKLAMNIYSGTFRQYTTDIISKQKTTVPKTYKYIPGKIPLKDNKLYKMGRTYAQK